MANNTIYKKWIGQWEITDMDSWEVESGWFIELNGKGSGSLHFLYVNAEIDYRIECNGDQERADFSFHGDDEGEEVFGRGWIKIEGENLEGYLCFHQGEESGFRAKIKKKSKR